LPILLSEPTTTLTDYAIAIVAAIFAVCLGRSGWSNQQLSVRLWSVAFAFVAMAAALGGSWHGFGLWLGTPLKQQLWQAMLYALSLASIAMLTGTIVSTVSPPLQRWLLLGAVGKSLLTWIELLRSPRFETAAIDYLVAMGMVLLLQLRSLSGLPTSSAAWLVAGILVSGLALGLLNSGLTLAPAFNQNDLYHLVQLVGLGLLYQGARQLKDR
jgi:hypothetical protein